MNIVFVSPEVVPYSKTGGLADVAGCLPGEIAALGHKVTVLTPYYRITKKMDPAARAVASGVAPVGAQLLPWTLYQASSAAKGVQTYFIGCDQFFDREGLYGTAQGDYEDSCSRFVFFCQACLQAVQSLQVQPEVWHCHDWQTAMIPVYLRLQHAEHPFLGQAGTVFTIHNLAYQGLFWHWDWPLLNLAWQHFNWRELEFHGKMNLLKGALVHADLVTTVSPAYAREIQTPELGCGLDGVLAERREELAGIVNGIESSVWHPATDRLLPATFTAQDLAGKRICRKALQRKFELPETDGPVVGMIGRLFEQKGFDLVARALEDLLRRDLQLVILGTGREEYHNLLQRMQQANPRKVAVAFAFDNGLAHLIEAGSDIFLMPSRYEPCGLNQLYSLAYGTLPLVRRVGGLADTVTDTTPETLANSTATGFTFDAYEPAALLAALDRALRIYSQQPAVWRQIQLTGMRQDWSWRTSARKYVEVYRRAQAKAFKRRGLTAPRETPG